MAGVGRMRDVFICDAIRTPIGSYGGILSSVRPDDLAAYVIKELLVRNSSIDPHDIDEIIFGCANQAGEDNRNVARMASLLAGVPVVVPASTINRLCASGMDAVALIARGIGIGDYELGIAGGVESMSRAPFVMSKAESSFGRQPKIFDTTIGWRFVNPILQQLYGTESMPETAENIAVDYVVSREDQDAFAYRSHQRYAFAFKAGYFSEEIVPIKIKSKTSGERVIECDEHPRNDVTLEKLSRLKCVNGGNSTITAGNSSGINDGAAAVIVASEAALKRYRLTPLVRIVASATIGVPPRVMGIGPVLASKRVLVKAELEISNMDIIEINEAFAAQVLSCLRELGVADDAMNVNPNGGAIALGHPLGMSGTRIILTAIRELRRRGSRYALCTMCVGVGQGMALIIEAC